MKVMGVNGALKTYYSIQTKEAWDMANKQKCLQGNPAYICFEDFEESYSWMMEQMSKRLPRYRGERPIWLWLEKPDMRQSLHAETNSAIVRLTIQLEEEDVLVSDFEDWHFVLNNSYLAYSEAEYEEYKRGEAKHGKPDTWVRIFEMERDVEEAWAGKEEDRRFQGVTGKIPINAITKVEHFIAR